MSWGVSFPAMSKEDFMADGLNAVALPESQSTKEHEEQLVVAKRQARLMLADGALGPLEHVKYVSGNFGGHSNADYGVKQNWSNTSLYINLYSANPPAPVESHEGNA